MKKNRSSISTMEALQLPTGKGQSKEHHEAATDDEGSQIL